MPPPTPDAQSGVKSLYDQLTELNKNVCSLESSIKITKVLKTSNTIAGKQGADLSSAATVQQTNPQHLQAYRCCAEKAPLTKVE